MTDGIAGRHRITTCESLALLRGEMSQACHCDRYGQRADKSESGATGGSEIAQPRLILGPLLAHAAGQQLIICDSEDYFVLMKSRM